MPKLGQMPFIFLELEVIFPMVKIIAFFLRTKAEFTHPGSSCIYGTAWQFFITYLGFAQSRYVIKNCKAMRKTHAETGCVNAH